MVFCIAIVGGLTLMMGQHIRSESLFYYFRLDDQVPENHLLRLVDKHIDFGFVHDRLKDSYSETGRPSIDPELFLACAAVTYLFFLLHSTGVTTHGLLDSHPLWASFFVSGRQSLVVCSDTSVAVLQDMSSHEVNLSDYVNANYRMTIAPSRETTADVLRDLAGRRYTAIADVGILTRFYHLPGMDPDRIQFRYARDVLPDDLKQSSVVLIGSRYSDPWVALFEPHMNFVFRTNPQQRISSVINRSPHPGEMPQYDYTQADDSHSVYGVVALRPNLRASGKVLILEGTSMAGTEAAADFVFDDHLLLPFLAKIKSRDGQVPYFEVLLQSINMNGSASQIRILCYRTSTD
jgi:hypothetical protein